MEYPNEYKKAPIQSKYAYVLNEINKYNILLDLVVDMKDYWCYNLKELENILDKLHDEYDEFIEMKKEGYKFRLYIETEVMGGETFRHRYYFKTIEEADKQIDKTQSSCRMWGEYWINEAIITDIEKDEMFRRI